MLGRPPHLIAKSLSHPKDDYRTVPELVAARSSIAPKNTAIVENGKSISYRKLHQRASEISKLLRACGVGRNNLVAVCLQRSAEMISAALAVLIAGGAYLPLDPSYPDERLVFMLNDARPLVLLTDRRLAQRLGAMGKWRTIALDGRLENFNSADARDYTNSGEDLAYVIYTSGSSGQPKGVQISHGSLLNLVRWHQQTFAVTPNDHATQLASPSFDAAVWELWPYLTAGSCVHVVDDAVRGEPTALRNWLVKEQITITFAPTPIAERLLDLEWPGETKLRILLTGGDVLHKHPPLGLPFTLVNNYGPTECTVVASSGPVLPNDHSDSLPSIGRPISGTFIYVLDAEMRRVVSGEVGEIYIGGAGLARGYLNRTELDREKFVANPFNGDRSARLYRTGDLARFLPDGQIEFLGRADDQIKVRGFRIEPNEIVKVLNQHPAVLQSAIVAHEHGNGDKSLAAYLVLKPGTQLRAAELREFLSRRLPEYTVPSVFVRLEALPLSSNGKVDRASLPKADATNRIVDTEGFAPRNSIEERVLGILEKLLETEGLGVDDNFFLVGGHSLLAAQLIGAIRDTFGVELPLRAVFSSPTAAGLSLLIEESLLAEVEAMPPEAVSKALAQTQNQA